MPSPSALVPLFFTSERALAAHYDRVARQLAFRGRTAAQARAWQRKARLAFARLLGLDRLKQAPPRPVKVGTARLGDLLREEWRIQTEQDVWMPFYLFIPAHPARQRLPLVLCPHGHGSGGKWATGGRHDIPLVRQTIEKHHYDYGLHIARAGFITACPDARGFGERREPALQNDRTHPAHLMGNSCHQLELSCAPLGLSVQGLWTWDLMRLLDHLARDPRIDARRIGCAGLSGGGMQTLDLVAVDPRVKAAVVSGYFYGVKESLLIQNSNCMCNLVPRLWESFDMGDIGALAAPRGLFVETGDRDNLNGKSGLKNVASQVRMARNVFSALKAGKNLVHHVFHGEHRWDGTRAIPWLVHQLAR